MRPCHAVRPLSCCAQSQHPERPVERSEPGVPGFRDYARNDEVADPTLYGEYRNVMLCVHPCHARTSPAMLAHPLPCPRILCHARTSPVVMRRIPTSCCAQSQHPEMPVERSELGVPGFRDCARNDKVERSEPGVPGLCDYARNDEVEDPTLCGEYRDVTRHTPLPCCAHTPCHARTPPVALRAPPPCSRAISRMAADSSGRSPRNSSYLILNP